MTISYEARKTEEGYSISCDRCGTDNCLTHFFEGLRMMDPSRLHGSVSTVEGKDGQYLCPFCAETTAIGGPMTYNSLSNQPASEKQVAQMMAQGFNLLLRLLKEGT